MKKLLIALLCHLMMLPTLSIADEVTMILDYVHITYYTGT